MELDRIAVAMRPRTPWEAIDLGHVMARRWWWQVFLIWALPAAIAFAVFTVMFHRYSWLPPLLVWWLKPLWDRGAIFVASRRLFGETLAMPDALRQLPSLYRRDLLASLLWRRLSVTRSFDLPVTLLEGLTGEARSARLEVLHPQVAGAAGGLTMVCVHIESFFALAFYALLYLFIPNELDPGFVAFAQWAEHTRHLGNALAVVSFCLVGPFYAVAGFALYISRRVDLEAWDVELRFRHLAARAAKRPTAGVLGLLLVVGIASAWPTATVRADAAQGEAVAAAPVSDTQLQAIELLSQPPFRRTEAVSGWRLKQVEPADSPAWLERLESFFQALGSFSAALSELLANPLKLLVYLLWTAFAGLVLWFLLRYRSAIKAVFVAPSMRPKPGPATLFGLDVTRESLPADIPGSVRAHWQRGEQRQAVSLLYRAFLSRLIHERGLSFSDGHTEGECIAIIKAASETTISDYAEQLTRLWQGLAYGHRSPSGTEIEALCHAWDGVISRAH